MLIHTDDPITFPYYILSRGLNYDQLLAGFKSCKGKYLGGIGGRIYFVEEEDAIRFLTAAGRL